MSDYDVSYVKGSWSNLKALDINTNYISKMGITELFKNLKNSTELEHIIVCKNWYMDHSQ